MWCEFYNEKTDSWNKPRLLLSTNTDLSAEDVIKTLNRWVQLTIIGYGLIQLLSLLPAERLADVMLQSPWRDKSEVTAGKIRDGLAKQFQRVNFFDWWRMTCNKIRPPT